MSKYSFSAGKFYFEKDDGEIKCIAFVNQDKQIEYPHGCKGAHGKTLEEWIRKNGMNLGNADEPDEPDEPDDNGVAVGDIPDEILPDFDKMLGVKTPGFEEFVKQYKLNDSQVAALVRRLERK